jgi:MoxR-like ATPase
MQGTTESKSTPIPLFQPTLEPFDLPQIDGWPAQRHQFEEESIWAIQAALATGRPLLVRGEPGTGKSQLARAAAQVMGRPFMYQVITSRTEVTDLLYEMDDVRRLAEAQVMGPGCKDNETLRRELAPERFIGPGKIWWATNWRSAKKQAELSGSFALHFTEEDWNKGCVLLIDEIDKADAELPNALLECFANQSFQVPQVKQAVSRDSEQPGPLVVVTTNEERELPSPFLRRCWVLHLTLEKDKEKLKEFLMGRGYVHFAAYYKAMADYKRVLEEAADLLISDRSAATERGLHKPGQAEYLDLCRAVFEIAVQQAKPALEVLGSVAKFALRKNPE